ncbi:hypothetical protein HYALB_00006446 [Hymenoscyphus albidus]|uniref:Uncharacterized protein n=1 Tax=Hymenoscyphus albidus TaxID=595503 RepID=A0A9N9LHW3_9HELO|nr:hypothetical protein HYALB_00006446 [Hymenoscyphus albidus]
MERGKQNGNYTAIRGQVEGLGNLASPEGLHQIPENLSPRNTTPAFAAESSSERSGPLFTDLTLSIDLGAANTCVSALLQGEGHEPTLNDIIKIAHYPGDVYGSNQVPTKIWYPDIPRTKEISGDPDHEDHHLTDVSDEEEKSGWWNDQRQTAPTNAEGNRLYDM